MLYILSIYCPMSSTRSSILRLLISPLLVDNLWKSSMGLKMVNSILLIGENVM